tara:strand:+ start:84 stop:338 length:255 start_codon:yes stop_codon:yes gene_type:complete
MIIKIFLTIILIFLTKNIAYSNEVDCKNFSKFSVEYVNCKATSLKKKSISAGKKFISDTKDYQKKEWSDEKKKIDKIKKKVLGE